MPEDGRIVTQLRALEAAATRAQDQAVLNTKVALVDNGYHVGTSADKKPHATIQLYRHLGLPSGKSFLAGVHLYTEGGASVKPKAARKPRKGKPIDLPPPTPMYTDKEVPPVEVRDGDKIVVMESKT